MNDGADETVKSKQQKDKADLVIVDLKNNLTLAKDENKRIQNEIGQARKDFLSEQQKSQNLTTQVERLRSLVENLDQTKDELLQRLQASVHDKRGGESDKAVLLNDMQTYKREILAKDA